MDHDRLIAIKSGGQSLRQLTDFCREIVAKGITDEFDKEILTLLSISKVTALDLSNNEMNKLGMKIGRLL